MAWKLTHPNSDQEIEVEADRVGMYQSQGWQTFKDRKPDAAPAPEKSEPEKL